MKIGNVLENKFSNFTKDMLQRLRYDRQDFLAENGMLFDVKNQITYQVIAEDNKLHVKLWNTTDQELIKKQEARLLDVDEGTENSFLAHIELGAIAGEIKNTVQQIEKRGQKLERQNRQSHK